MGGDALVPVAEEAVRQWGFDRGVGVGVGPDSKPLNHPARHLAGTYAGKRDGNGNGINRLNAPSEWLAAASRPVRPVLCPPLRQPPGASRTPSGLQNCRQEISGHVAPRLARA